MDRHATISLYPGVLDYKISMIPEKEWYEKPIEGLTIDNSPLVDPETGRWSAYVAPWNQYHSSYITADGNRYKPIPSPTQYRYANSVLKETFPDGDHIRVAGIPVWTGHVEGLTAWDDPNSMMANRAEFTKIRARFKETDHGIVAMGRIMPSATREDLETIIAHPLSGEWAPNPNVGERLDFSGAVYVGRGAFRNMEYKDWKDDKVLASASYDIVLAADGRLESVKATLGEETVVVHKHVHEIKINENSEPVVVASDNAILDTPIKTESGDLQQRVESLEADLDEIRNALSQLEVQNRELPSI